MKNLIYLLLAVCLFISCSDDDPIDDGDTTQDYTSYEFVITGGEIIFETMISGYFDEEGKCILLCDHGNHTDGTPTDKFIMPAYIEKIYLFYGAEDLLYGRIEKSYNPKENTHNVFVLDKNPGGLPVYDKTEYNWPH